MRHEGGLRYAVLGVIGRNEGGVHGWALKRQFERMLGDFWQLNFGEVYRVLDKLADDGLIQQLLCEEGSNRKLYRITGKGRQSLDDFITTPPTDAPRPLRQELAVKLRFATTEQVPGLFKLIEHQRAAYMGQLSRLSIQRRKLRGLHKEQEIWVTGLLIAHAELSVRADLTWLDIVVQELKERFPPH